MSTKATRKDRSDNAQNQEKGATRAKLKDQNVTIAWSSKDPPFRSTPMVAATPIGNLSPLSSKHSHEEESSKDTSIEESLHSSVSKGDDATQVRSSIDMKDLMAKFNKLQKEFDLDKVRH